MLSKWKKWTAQSWGDKLFDVANHIMLCLLAAICLYPLYYIVVVSFSETPYGAYLWPNGFTLEGYRFVLGDSDLWISYRNTLFYAIGGVFFSLCLTVPCAYALSRKDLPGKKILNLYLLVTMFVSGGMIPTYLTVQKMHLLNTWAVVIIMTGVNVYNVFVARTFFATTIPEELLDASRIDGCGNGGFLLKVVLPLSKPILAVLALWIGVGRWNSYFTELLYLRDEEKYPLAMYLKKVLWQVESLSKLITEGAEKGEIVEVTQSILDMAKLSSVMQYVIIVVATIPMMILYPFIQKYFAKGVMIGSVKG